MLELMNHCGDVLMTRVYSWQQSYQDAMLELNREALRTKIVHAVSGLEKRMRELMSQQDAESVAERHAIVDALNGLGAIQRLELRAPSETGGPSRPTAT